MIRINKNLIIFASLIFILGGFVLSSLQKLSPLLSHTIYYCQSIVNSLSMPIPYYLGTIPFLLASFLLFVVILRLSIIYIKVQFLRNNLIKNEQSNVRLSKLLKKLNLVDKTCLIESEKQFAFCLGIRSPKIYLSTRLLDSLTLQETEAVLRHERYHLKNKDTFTMLVASIGQSLLPFFPLISDFLANFRIEREIQADKEAVQGFGSEKVFISVLKKLLNAPSVATVTVSAIADQDTLEPRICALVKKDFRFKKFRIKHIFISLVSVFVMGVITLAPVQAIEINHPGDDVIMICQNNNQCLNSCRQKYSTSRKNYSEELPYTPIK